MAQSFRTNLANVVKHYSQVLKIPVTKTTLKENLEQNPYYPSLYSISNEFEKLGVANEGFAVNEQDLDKLEPPFITYCSGQNTGKDFILVTSINNSSVSYISESNSIKTISRQQFLNQWQKIVFVAEASAKSGEKNYANNLRLEQTKKRKKFFLYGTIAVIFIILISRLFADTASDSLIPAIVITLIKLFGLTVTVLLLIYEVDKSNHFVKNICSAGKQTNCDAVLNSKAGKFFGMSWGELGFFYFAASTLFLLVPGINFTSKLPWLAIASTFVSFYIIFSIYYQWKIVKQWCPLCLAVQAVLAMELCFAVLNYWTVNNPVGKLELSVLFPSLCCILLVFTSWYLLKPVFLAAKEAPVYTAAYKRLLYNPDIFNSMLQQQTAAPDGWQNLGITIGHPNATNTIIKICSPYCQPCAEAHKILEDIIKRNNNYNLKIIFFVSSAEINEVNKPAKHLLAIASTGNTRLIEDALDFWYLSKIKDYTSLASKFPIDSALQFQNEEIDKMKVWCEEAEIKGTPTIFINGKKLPQTYSIKELQYVI